MPLDDESLPRWREFLGRLLAFLPHIVTVRSIESYATVAWNSGRIDYRLDGRKLMLRMEPEENDIAPPPEATRLVGPSAVRASSFPIDMVPSKRHVTERVGEYDLMVQLPEDHYAPSPGDVVMMKCRDDHERERQYDNWAETVRIVGRVLETNEKDRLCVVHWSPAELNVDVSSPESFPEYSEPDATDPLVAAAAAVCPIVGKLLIGGVIRSLPNATAVVKWWNGNVEVVPMPLLNTVRFDELENQQAEGEEGEEEEQEDEDVARSHRRRHQRRRTRTLTPPRWPAAARWAVSSRMCRTLSAGHSALTRARRRVPRQSPTLPPRRQPCQKQEKVPLRTERWRSRRPPRRSPS
jgi:hypothetical protein